MCHSPVRQREVPHAVRAPFFVAARCAAAGWLRRTGAQLAQHTDLERGDRLMAAKKKAAAKKGGKKK
jgi:hypothetical protein